jgi:hypothetical protein
VLSESLYLRLGRPHVALFRFLLEASEGVALFTSLGGDAAGNEVLCLRYAPGTRREVVRFLNQVCGECPLVLLSR